MEGKNQGDQVYYAYSTSHTEVFIPDASTLQKLPSGLFEEGAAVVHVESLRVPLDRATVAVKIVGTCFHYGVSICSNTDNFNKARGREMALARLEAGFGRTCFTGTAYESLMTDEDSTRTAALRFLTRVVNSVELKPNKYKRRISEFEKRRKSTPRAIEPAKPSKEEKEIVKSGGFLKNLMG